MTKENQDKLFEKYPKIFEHRFLPMTVTCMCWGIECGDGWFNILDTLCSKIQHYIDSNNVSQVHASQVKEKYGSLRFYVDKDYDEVDAFIAEAESESYETCERCGSRDDVQRTGRSWINYYCGKCRKEIQQESQQNSLSGI